MSVSSTIAILSSTVLSSHNHHERLDINDINAENYKDYLNSSDFETRAKIAEQGYGLGLLVDDPDEDVRVEVAKHSFGLNTLRDDKSDYVRAEVKLQLSKRQRT